MLNEERIKLMTKMASYEENEGKKNISIGSYFRGDYMSLQVLKSIIHATVAFFVVLGLYILYDLEAFMQELYKLDLFSLGKKVAILYVIVVASYAGISYLIYSYRYNKAKASLKCYYNNLKKLYEEYNNDNSKL